MGNQSVGNEGIPDRQICSWKATSSTGEISNKQTQKHANLLAFTSVVVNWNANPSCFICQGVMSLIKPH